MCVCVLYIAEFWISVAMTLIRKTSRQRIVCAFYIKYSTPLKYLYLHFNFLFITTILTFDHNTKLSLFHRIKHCSSYFIAVSGILIFMCQEVRLFSFNIFKLRKSLISKTKIMKFSLYTGSLTIDSIYYLLRNINFSLRNFF